MAQSRINIEEENRKMAQSKRSIASDSLQKFQLQVLNLDNNNEVAGELGPLQYLSGLTGTPMDKIINWLLLIIIFVFDPLAISLVVAANFAFDKAYPKKKYKENLYGEEVEENNQSWDEFIKNETYEHEPATLEEQAKHTDWEEAEKRMEIIGQNGNNGEHYENMDVDPNLKLIRKDGRTVDLKEYVQNFIKKPKDDNTKIY